MQLPKIAEVRGMRILTTRQLAEAYGADTKTIQYNFRYNKERYVLGKHYIEIEGKELRELKTRNEFHSTLKYAKSAYLWTEKGALLHAKSLNTDKAWEVYDYLVDFYFRAKEQPVIEEAKPEPVRKTSGREVVDIPENVKIQKAILDVKNYTIALDTVIEEFNKYHCEGNYIHLRYVIDMLWITLGRKITDLEGIMPNKVVKAGY